MAADRKYINLTNAAHEVGGFMHRNFKGIPHTGPFAGMGREAAVKYAAAATAATSSARRHPRK